ncbi:MAG: alpha/beta hydrolase [Pseudomonadota bacterium]|nr:alpha/beta hydrolase [Pseudomonadota bacterium]
MEAKTSRLQVSYLSWGDSNGLPIVFVHGFPDSPVGWEAVVNCLGDSNVNALAPFSCGFGNTRRLDDQSPKYGRIAIRAYDLVEFLDALGLEKFILVGQDIGALTAQSATILLRDRVVGLVSLFEYGVSFQAAVGKPTPESLHALWYQWFFNLPWSNYPFQSDYKNICEYLWQQWSPEWRFESSEFEYTAKAFENDDFVDTVLNGYRGDASLPKFDVKQFIEFEKQLASAPVVPVPTTVIVGDSDGLAAPRPPEEKFFPNGYKRVILKGVGHFAHRENPRQVADEILEYVSPLPE